MKSGFTKTAQFSPERAPILDATTVRLILKNVRNLQRSKNESHSDTEHRLFYLITVFTAYLLFYIALYVGHLSPRVCPRRPLAYLAIFVTLNKRI